MTGNGWTETYVSIHVGQRRGETREYGNPSASLWGKLTSRHFARRVQLQTGALGLSNGLGDGTGRGAVQCVQRLHLG